MVLTRFNFFQVQRLDSNPDPACGAAEYVILMFVIVVKQIDVLFVKKRFGIETERSWMGSWLWFVKSFFILSQICWEPLCYEILDCLFGIFSSVRLKLRF